MVTSFFNEFAVLLSLSVIIGFIAIKLRQPLIFSFIIAGVIVGPSFLGWITPQSEIEVLASLGIALLLFIVGLKLDLQLIKSFGSVTLLIGLSQIIATTVLGYLLCLLLGFSYLSAFYLALVLTFSSTIIIIKILSDNYEIDSLYGQISVGILIVQDLVVVIVIIVLSSLNINYDTDTQLIWEILSLVFKGIGFLTVLGFIMLYILPPFLEQLASSKELLILFALAWAMFLAVAAEALGFSREVGGFLAGFSLASTKFREAIASRLETVRNILVLFFFLNMGATLKLTALQSDILTALLLSIFVLVAKPLIVMVLMGLFRFRKRSGFLTGLTMGQISEFSLILAALGASLGYVNENTEGLITLVALITIGLSTYMIIYANDLYQWLSPWLTHLERHVRYREDLFTAQYNKDIDVIIYGFGRHGEHIAKILETYGFKILGIDFDPTKIKTWKQANIIIRYGDAEDADFQKTVPLNHVKWVVSTIPHIEANRHLVSSLRERNYEGKIALCVYRDHEANYIKKLGIDLIIFPYKDAALSAAKHLVERMK